MTETRELSSEEVDVVSGGKIHVVRIAGFTFAHDDISGATTVGAGGAWVTRGTMPNGTPYNQVETPPQ